MKEKTSKHNLTYQIALASIILSLSILLLCLANTLPFLDLFFFIFIPFITACFALRSNYIGQILFILGIAAICFIDIQVGFFNLLPKSILGILFGDLVKKIRLNYFTYLGLVIANFLIEAVLIFPIKLIYQIDLIQAYSTFFKIDIDVFKTIFPLFYLSISFIVCLFTFMFCKNQADFFKFNLSNFNIDKPISYFILNGICFILTLVFAFTYISLSYFFLLILGVTSLYIFIVNFVYKNKKYLIINISILTLIIIISFIGGIFTQDIFKYLLILPSLLYCNMYYLFMIKYKSKLVDLSTNSTKDLLE